MDNQHQQIKGYRDLNATEISLMNEVKAHGAQLDDLIERIKQYHRQQKLAASGATASSMTDRDELQRLARTEPERWLAMGRTDLQTGIMKLVRSVAQPESF